MSTHPAGTESAPDKAAVGSVEWSLEGSIAVVTMRHRPYNLLDAVLSRQLIETLGEVGRSGARAAILDSGLRHFSAGADLNAMLAAADASGDGDLGWPMVELLDAFDALPFPIVAAVHGICVGGGLELALACDLVVAAESAKLGSVEATVGLHPLMGGIQRVAQRAGAARAKEMALLGRRYDARTLERWNVINRVVGDEDLADAAETIAREVAGGPTIAHRATKQLVGVAISDGVRAADRAMTDIQRAIFTSADFRTGVQSFSDNGPGMAIFEGR
jgi:enoyl-CoA hydratase/carnithine racemase